MTRLFVEPGAGTFVNVSDAVGPMLPTRLPFELWESLMTDTPFSVAFSAWKVFPRQTVIGHFQVVPFSVHDSGPSLVVSPVDSPCIPQLPVECEDEHLPSMPAVVGHALAYGAAPAFEAEPRRPGTTSFPTLAPLQ